MRSDPMIRVISAAVALTVLAAGGASAQRETPPPQQLGPSLKSAVITSALDPASVNSSIVETTLERHEALGGKTSGKRGGWAAVGPMPSSEDVVQAAIDQAQEQNTVIVISGGDSAASVGIANSFSDTTFLDVAQGPPCVTLDGQFDPSGTCAGGDFNLPFNYTSIDFAVEDGAYLAGVLAAAYSRGDPIGIISGAADCEMCNRYVQGFVTGARSWDPEIDIELAYLADDEVNGFGDPASAETFARAFIDVHRPRVLLPVGRAASSGMIGAACETGEVLVVGAGVDVARERPDLADCVLTSVVPDIGRAVQEGMNAFANGTLERVIVWDIANEGVAVAYPEQRLTLPVETNERFTDARTSIITDQVDTCPLDCGAPVDLDGSVSEADAAAE